MEAIAIITAALTPNKTGLCEGSLFSGGCQIDPSPPPPPSFHISRRTNLISM